MFIEIVHTSQGRIYKTYYTSLQKANLALNSALVYQLGGSLRYPINLYIQDGKLCITDKDDLLGYYEGHLNSTVQIRLTENKGEYLDLGIAF